MLGANGRRRGARSFREAAVTSARFRWSLWPNDRTPRGGNRAATSS